MKKFTQPGTFSTIVLLSFIIFTIVLLLIIGFNETVPVVIFSFVILTFIMCLLIFYKMTIIIDDTCLTFIMGIGLIKKSYPLSDIESCRPVRNTVLDGIGIHMTSSGWLYNVSGLSAVELSFKNRKSKIRIGTDKPEEIAEEVGAKITLLQTGSFYEKSGIQGLYLTVAVLIAFIGILVFIFVSGSREPAVTFSDSSLAISGMYGFSIGYADIINTDTLQTFPGIKSRTNGFAAGSILKGHFKLSGNSKVMLFLKEGNPPYILINTKTTPIYLNSANPVKTREYFKNIKERISRDR
jgi:hypothetical protein